MKTIPLLFLLGLALLPAPLNGQRAREQVREGNRLYEEGRFDEAHQKYLEALLEDPESPMVRFNDGVALYGAEDFQPAMERFRQALESEDPELRKSAWYNLGNALYRQQQLQESLEAYKEALLADPADADAKHNLERVLEQLQEQEQQEGGDPNQEDQEEEDEQEQQPQNQPGQEPQQDPSQDEQDSQDQPPEGEGSPQEGEPQEGEGEPQPQPGQMTPEEAQRLLEALQEDPGDVNRKRAAATGRRPRKDW
jgi:Ca-activated chloride channel family protein